MAGASNSAEEAVATKSCFSAPWLILISLCAIVVRYLISLNPYSGYMNSPMFGDLEAQRHWMEITTNLPLYDWYRNTTNNDLLYWGLDYPPLTAFHECLMGKFVEYLYPEMIQLNSSRGIETIEAILFMRLSVIVSDVLIYIPACLLFVTITLKGKTEKQRLITYINLLFAPPLLLIDHAHFQYNSICLGLVIMSIVAIQADWDCIGSFFFVMAIGYKQIALYYSLVLFVLLLKKCYVKRDIWHLLKIGGVVILSFSVLFIPFIISTPAYMSKIDTISAIMHRMFPWDRWLFEDKVASFWCTLHNIVKLNYLFTTSNLKLVCMICTLFSVIPSLILLWKNASLDSILDSLFNCSISFYLFSYHVHEKTILFPLLPILMKSYKYPANSSWFSLAASFSMIPLYCKDGNLLMAVMYSVIFFLVANDFTYPSFCSSKWLNNCAFNYIIFMMLLLLAYYCVPPPERYPDLHSVFISAFSCCIFMLFGFNILKQQYLSMKVKEE